MEFWQRLRQQVWQIWQQMSLRRRMALAVVTLLSLLAVVGVGYWAVQPEYRVLYSGLAPEDAGAVTSYLQGQGISYRLESGGATVLVPAEQVSRARLGLAVEGLPAKSGKGFELFDQSSLGMTPFTQHVNYLRALQGELAKTIMQIEPVQYARVHIVRPDPSPFLRNPQPTTASVMLRLKPGAALSRSLTAGIVALVARSGEGLAPENVTVVDASGRLLSDSQEPSGGAFASHLEQRRALESYLASKAEELLTRVLGPGRAIVRVAADINTQRLKERKESYNPEGRVVNYEKSTTTKSTSALGSARGAAGAQSNLPGKAGAGNNPANSSSQEEVTETGFAVSKVIQEFEDKVGTIQRLTVAALVDLSERPGSQGGKSTPGITLADVQELIKQAVGFRPERDQIKVSNAPLEGPMLETSSEDAQRENQGWNNILSLVRTVSLSIGGIMTLILIWMLLRRFRPASQAAVTSAPQRKPALERLSALAQQDPQAVARVLTAWLEQANGAPAGR